MSMVGLWWPLALSEEITSERPQGRSCAGADYVLFRDRDGAAHALEDRCAHRRVPLSLGRIREDGSLQCGYHGWSYNGADGQCVAIAVLGADERVPASYKVEAFPTLDVGGFVYVWSGEAAAAALSSPALPVATGPEGAVEARGAALLTVSHQTFVETLLDAPGLLLELDGLEILPESLGDPALRDGQVVSEFAVDFPGRSGHPTRRPVDTPFVLRVSVAPGTGQALVRVQGLDETPAVVAQLAPSPMRPSVAAVRWRVRAAAPYGLSLRSHIDPQALAALTYGPGGDLWRSGASTPELKRTA